MFKPLKYLLALLCVSSSLAQPADSSAWTISARAHYGFIAEHRAAMGHLVEGHISGFEIDFFKHASGSKLWHHENNFPEYGLVAAAYDLGNPSKLGQMYALGAAFELPLNRRVRASRLILRLGAGLCYVTKQFHAIDNHKNNVVSQPLNVFINFAFGWHFPINNRLRIDAGINAAHGSNAKWSIPNLGVNIVSGFLGFTIHTKPLKSIAPIPRDSSTKRIARNEIFISAGYGWTMIDPPGSGRFFCQSYGLNYYRNIRNTHKIGIGIDVFHNSSNQEGLNRVRNERYPNSADFIQGGIRLCYAYNVGRFSFPVEMGAYVYDKFKVDGLFYHRVGVRFYSKWNVVLGWCLKSHWAVASFQEFSLGYRLGLKKKNAKI